jgi:hypothetical protein
MTQLPFDQLMRELARYLGTPLSQDRGIYRLIVPLAMGRQQEVSASIRVDESGREIIAIVSTVGQASRRVDPWRLLQANADPLYCRVAVINGMVAVIGSQLYHTAQPEEVLLILREAAEFADRLERTLFLHDQF